MLANRYMRMLCNQLVSWVCNRCTTDATHIFPLHPPSTQGTKNKYGCLKAHRQDPTDTYAKVVERASGIAASAPRRRKSNIIFL